MALFDIRPATSITGGHERIMKFRPTAASTFEYGDPVVLVTAGTVTEATSPVIVPGGMIGISAGRALDTDGVTLRREVENMIPTNVMTWRSRNYSSGGAGVSVFPLANATALAQIGDGVGLVAVGGVWFVDSGTATSIGRIVDFLDARGVSITNTPVAGTGPAAVEVVCTFLVGQLDGTTLATAIVSDAA